MADGGGGVGGSAVESRRMEMEVEIQVDRWWSHGRWRWRCRFQVLTSSKKFSIGASPAGPLPTTNVNHGRKGLVFLDSPSVSYLFTNNPSTLVHSSIDPAIILLILPY
ncbi:hypothetical protein E3N88_09872 [Mikania micrantha]|uniref:Uncharacterized protein n=1 Tax=Mikania micrantha TaxID=192012 RepID=A0A5N6PMK6_9ASTR|nr:hypothetical protein E3N88_09872 [Mikania micrantha]